MKKLSWIVGVVGICIASSSFAWNRSNAVTLTLADAYYNMNSKRHADNAGMPNGAIAFNFDERWAAELGFGVINTHYHNTTGLRGVLYTLDGIYRFKPYWYLQPYAIAGIGMIGLKPQINTQNQYQANVNAGIGTQLYTDKTVALRAEVRDLYTLSGGINDFMVNFGVSFQLGG